MLLVEPTPDSPKFRAERNQSPTHAGIQRVMNLRVGITVTLLAAMTACTFAQSAAGAWKGKLNLTMDLPKTSDPKMKALMDQQMAAMKAITIHLTFKADKTYTLTTSGTPPQMGGGQTDKGKWTQTGKTVTITSTKVASKENKPQKMTLSADGKTLTMLIPGPNGKPGGNILFKR
jgi:hypothetical protein